MLQVEGLQSDIFMAGPAHISRYPLCGGGVPITCKLCEFMRFHEISFWRGIFFWEVVVIVVKYDLQNPRFPSKNREVFEPFEIHPTYCPRAWGKVTHLIFPPKIGVLLPRLWWIWRCLAPIPRKLWISPANWRGWGSQPLRPGGGAEIWANLYTLENSLLMVDDWWWWLMMIG